MIHSVRKAVLGISPREALFQQRGFEDCDPDVRKRLEKVIRTFLVGYHFTLEEPKRPERVIARLEGEFDGHHVGFAFEGVGLCYALFDLLIPTRRCRLKEFIEGPGASHDYITAVGAGFAIAKIPWGRSSLARYLENLDPLVSWCVPDGYGFYQGFFNHRRYIDGCRQPAALLPYAGQLFDSGIGRSMWWVLGADPNRIAAAIGRFPESRQGELWCGIGVAAAYAGGVELGLLPAFRGLAGRYLADFLSGVPFAARMRQKGANQSAWTDNACQTLLGLSSDEAANRVANCATDAFSEWTHGTAQKRQVAYSLVRQKLRSQFDSHYSHSSPDAAPTLACT